MGATTDDGAGLGSARADRLGVRRGAIEFGDRDRSSTAIRPSRAPMRPCSWCGCGSCQSGQFMGSALASLGSAADFKSSQS